MDWTQHSHTDSLRVEIDGEIDEQSNQPAASKRPLSRYCGTVEQWFSGRLGFLLETIERERGAYEPPTASLVCTEYRDLTWMMLDIWDMSASQVASTTVCHTPRSTSAQYTA